jgi:cytochrome c oxidase subunit 4
MKAKTRTQPAPPSLSTYLWVWGALLALLALTVGSSYVPLHGFNAAANVLIAAAKAGLVALFFMRLRTSDGLVRLAAVTGVIWALILTSLSLLDVLTRT